MLSCRYCQAKNENDRAGCGFLCQRGGFHIFCEEKYGFRVYVDVIQNLSLLFPRRALDDGFIYQDDKGPERLLGNVQQ